MRKSHARPSNQYRYEHYDPRGGSGEWVSGPGGKPDLPTPVTDDRPADTEPAGTEPTDAEEK